MPRIKFIHKVIIRIYFFFFKKFQLFFQILNLLFQIILKFLFPITIVNQESEINYINKISQNSKTYLTFFSNKWRLKQFKNDIRNITQEPVKLINLTIKKKNIISYFLDKNIRLVPIINLYKTIFIYLFNYPYMMNYFSKLYDSLFIYYLIKIKKDLNNCDVLVKETYSFDIRAMCLGAESNNNSIYKIIYNEDNILPYPVYSLNLNKKILIFNNYIQKRPRKLLNTITKLNEDNELIIVQPSDSTISSPTLYEYYCYEDIIKALSVIKFKGKVLFVFHPSNSKLSVHIKRAFCNLFKNIYESKFQLKSFHRRGNIENLSEHTSNIISIDYSQSYRFMLEGNKKLINYNRYNSRLYGPIDKIFMQSGNYVDVNNYKMLENTLSKNLNCVDV